MKQFIKINGMLIALIISTINPIKTSITEDISEKIPLNLHADERKHHESIIESTQEEDDAKTVIDDLDDEEKKCCNLATVVITAVVKLADITLMILSMVKR